MAYSSITKPTDYFNTILWTGNGSAGTGQTGVGFQPDFTWIKARSGTQGAQSHILNDAVRGAGKYLFSDSNDAESTDTNRLTSFDSDGFTVGSNNAVNASSTTYVAWNWLGANGTSSNSDGSITSTVSANTTAGFSVVKYTGAGSGTTTTIGHGLGGVPEMYIVKSLDSVGNWQTYHHKMSSAPETDYMQLDNTSAVADYTFWGDTAPTSTVFTVKDGNDVNESGEEYIALCFRGIKGYSKFGKYTGNGNADGPFLYMGFKPAMVIYKRASDGTNNWSIFDNKRDTHNVIDAQLNPNLADAEGTSSRGDFTSNGFKIRSSSGSVNNSGSTYIYMAFAENPFVGNDSGTAVPITAR